MAFVPPHDRVLDTSTSNSQAVFSITGSGFNTSYNTFSAFMSIGDTTIGGVVEEGVAFASGVLTYSASNQVTVTTAFESKGTFSTSGTKRVFMGQPAKGPLTATPSALSNDQGIIVSQSTPNGGSVAGPVHLNSITVIDGTQTVTGSGDDSFGQIANRTNAFQVNHRVTGGSANHFGINSQVDVTGSNGGVIALNGGIRINSGSTITGDAWAGINFVKVGATSNLNQSAIGHESEMLVATGGVLRDRIGYSANSQGPVAATGIDAAFCANLFTSNASPYNGAAPWKIGLYFSSNLYSAATFPIASTGDIIKADTGTVNNLLNAPNLTVSNSYISLPKWWVDPSGNAAFGAASTTGFGNAVTHTVTGGGFAQIFGQANSATGADGFVTKDSSGNNQLAAIIAESSFSGTSFGQSLANYARIAAQGTNNLGLMVGTLTNVPVILGSNNTYAGQITGGQQVQLGPNKVAPLTGPLLTISRNAAASVALGTPTGISGTNQNLLNLVGVDGSSADLTIQAFGTSVNGAVRYFRARGTAASPTAVGSGDTLMSNFGYGYYTSGGPAYVAGGGFVVAATEAFDSTHSGTRVDFYATPTGTTGIANGASVGAGLMVGTTTDPGAGNIVATGKIRSGSFTVATLPSSPTAGDTVWCSNCRVFNGAGTQEGAGVGTGGFVTYNSSAWKIAGTNVTAIA